MDSAISITGVEKYQIEEVEPEGEAENQLQGLDEAEANLGDSEEPDRDEEEEEEKKEEEEKSELEYWVRCEKCQKCASFLHLGDQMRTSIATASLCDVHNHATSAKPPAARCCVLPTEYR